ncbi:flagellar FlbD family protein [Dorea sp. D27]|uniref:flagellar FlbD family protein n=1 Tax=Dorea sp. D27 TaxID=658665 RepID=UPI0006731F3A|nr:flagellar FlbD family protein [Dorea sp. D27]KMZ54312.1 flagellar protein [Dorea sp. D27]
MIELTKLNGEPVLINSHQIEFIELIPESKIIMMNGKYHIVREDKDEIIRKVIIFNNQCIHYPRNEEDQTWT